MNSHNVYESRTMLEQLDELTQPPFDLLDKAARVISSLQPPPPPSPHGLSFLPSLANPHSFVNVDVHELVSRALYFSFAFFAL